MSRPTMHKYPVVALQPGREKPVRQRHPWVFSGAIASISEDAADGAIVDLCDAQGAFLARGYLNRRSQIQVRLLTWDAAEAIDAAFWRRRLQAAIAMRRELPEVQGCTALRLVNAESDYLPGLTVDRLDDFLVLQAGTLGVEQRKQMLAELLLELTGCRGVVERSDMAARRLEGLPAASGPLAGEPPPDLIEVVEDGLIFLVNLLHGQKTGFYSDQRANRRRVAAYCAGKRVLNAFSYTGAFGLHALRSGATHVVNIDSSVPALELAEANLRRNGFDPDRQAENIAGDVFQVLRDWQADPARRYDVVILDPPKFAHNQAAMERALRGYKEINRLALGLLSPGGVLATFSCSGLVSAELFQKVVFSAAIDAGRDVQILETLRQSADHPVALTFPEGEYLKGLIVRAACAPREAHA
ncbi:class I SAM-dependent rRNA methyltransferase [Caldilinea sp.]|uniref:class I SAM-dependent rRNA methyltransferase n=1 Tax=Caldilinea sp. TaxID=2293560 RepID=UPI00262BBF4A|nr:class I SAM-dependent rRNA methyltransferase [Caldilinea sp.]